VEAGCDWSVTAPDLEEIIAAAQDHVATAHASVELEDVIEAAVTDVPDEAAR
jgi:predicted small metal-binding protein